jgi:hypothetical protein
MPPASFEIEKTGHPERTGVPIAPAFGAMGWRSEGPLRSFAATKLHRLVLRFAQNDTGLEE